jgi:hypothetical protein
VLDPDKVLNQHFETLYKEFNERRVINITVLELAARDFFDKHANDLDPGPGAAHDHFFSSFVEIWIDVMRRGLYDCAEWIWQESIEIAKRWEGDNKPHLIHKGTPLYFWGGTIIRRGDLRKGFLFLHAALDEDRRKHHKKDEDPYTPALKFVTLDTRSEEQFLYDLVKPAAKEVASLLESYRKSSGSILQFEDLQRRYMQSFEVRDIVFILALVVFEKMNLQRVFEQVDSGREFGSQLCANCLFDLCLVVEESIRLKNTDSGKGTFLHQATYLAKKCGWPLSGNPLEEINNCQKDNLDNCIRNLLNDTMQVASRGPVSSLERDLWITYVLRNSTAHTLASKKVISDHFEELYRSIMNTLFKVIDVLY